jgi:hypothetical protein
MAYKDPNKQREYQKEWIRKNNTQKEKNKTNGRNRKKLIAEKMFNYKLSIGKCYSCNTYDHPHCLDFHHLGEEEKKDTICALVGGGYKWEKIEEEMNKCILLCSSCHRKLHKELLELIPITK